MAKSRAIEDALAELAAVRADPAAGDAAAALRRALKGKSSHVAAKAARLAGELELPALVPDLLAAFDKLMVDAVKSDPGCAAKHAIADALYRLGACEAGVFLRGIRHRQMEPVWGGRTDTATALRGVCALGLVRMNYREVLSELADLLADPEAPARADAARALAYSENELGAPLLRLKALLGDDDPSVVAECLTALLRLAPAASLPFVAQFLDRADAAQQEAAALALGGSRLPEAFDTLRQWWERTLKPDLRRTALLAIAMLRRDEGIDFLLAQVAGDSGPSARDAVAALSLYRHDDSVAQRVRDAAAQSAIDLRQVLAETFDSD